MLDLLIVSANPVCIDSWFIIIVCIIIVMG